MLGVHGVGNGVTALATAKRGTPTQHAAKEKIVVEDDHKMAEVHEDKALVQPVSSEPSNAAAAAAAAAATATAIGTAGTGGSSPASAAASNQRESSGRGRREQRRLGRPPVRPSMTPAETLKKFASKLTPFEQSEVSHSARLQEPSPRGSTQAPRTRAPTHIHPLRTH